MLFRKFNQLYFPALFSAAFMVMAASAAAQQSSSRSVEAAPEDQDDDDEISAPERAVIAPRRERSRKLQAPIGDRAAATGISAPPAPPQAVGENRSGVDLTARPTDPTHRVSATFQVEFEIPFLINAGDWPLYPWKAAPVFTKQTRPVRKASAVLEDDCGHWIKGELSA